MPHEGQYISFHLFTPYDTARLHVCYRPVGNERASNARHHPATGLAEVDDGWLVTGLARAAVRLPDGGMSSDAYYVDTFSTSASLTETLSSRNSPSAGSGFNTSR